MKPLISSHEQKQSIYKKLANNDVEGLRACNIQNTDLNIFEPVEDLAFIDEEVTPLIYCAYYGKTELAKLLFKNKFIDIDLETRHNKQNALIVACMGGNYEMVKFLLDAGAEVNKPNAFHQTPLVATIYRLIEEAGSFENKCICFRMADLLVLRGADVNWFIDKQKGYTILHFLCSSTIRMHKTEKQLNYDIIKFLVERGANVNLKGLDDKKPEDLVIGHCNMTAILDLLLKKKEPLVPNQALNLDKQSTRSDISKQDMKPMASASTLRRRNSTLFKDMIEDKTDINFGFRSKGEKTSNSVSGPPSRGEYTEDKPGWSIWSVCNKKINNR